MSLRKLALQVGFTALSFSVICSANLALALGLGELSLRSTLNEPFLAELSLNDVGDLSADEIIMTFASAEDFVRNKMERHYFFNDFVFEVILADPQRPRVMISSHSVVREPVLEFIIESRWPTGRVQREYTVLLDQPKAID